MCVVYATYIYHVIYVKLLLQYRYNLVSFLPYFRALTYYSVAKWRKEKEKGKREVGGGVWCICICKCIYRL